MSWRETNRCPLRKAVICAGSAGRERAANNINPGQNLDSFSVEWTFADGTKAYDVVRNPVPGEYQVKIRRQASS